MSSDNGIYILRTLRTRRIKGACSIKSEPHYVYRVAHAQAIDNFDWYEQNQPYNLGFYMQTIWGSSEVFESRNAALRYAHSIERRYDILEYGVCELRTKDYIFPGEM